MKKIVALVCSLVMACSLVSCGSSTIDTDLCTGSWALYSVTDADGYEVEIYSTLYMDVSEDEMVLTNDSSDDEWVSTDMTWAVDGFLASDDEGTTFAVAYNDDAAELSYTTGDGLTYYFW